MGTGFDVHRLRSGEGLHLCGVFITCDMALVGHSDADVGLHALTDAVLGAAGAGDIGQHFPPSDQRWRGADSAQFLVHAMELAREAGIRPVHADITLICERPKIGPLRDAMRARVAELTGLAPARVNIKATTTEKLGFTGRGEGIAAQGSLYRSPDMSTLPSILTDTARELVKQSSKRKVTLASAESCTGGLVAAAITEIAGSSAVLERGFVTYSNAAKARKPGACLWPLIAQHGAVSEEVACAMAEGALFNSHAQIAVSITGIAGPGRRQRTQACRAGLVRAGKAR